MGKILNVHKQYETILVEDFIKSDDGVIWYQTANGYIAQFAPNQTPLVIDYPINAFTYAVNFTLSVEGGFANDIRDKGGMTKFGISKAAFPLLDIEKLTLAKAIDIYYNNYWRALNLPKSIDLYLSATVFDMAVNAGVGTAKNLLLYHDTYQGYNSARITLYKSFGQYGIYGDAWINRIRQLDKYIDSVKL